MALALTRRAASSGFAWAGIDGAERKFAEELYEYQAAVTDTDRQWELGDVLFSLTALARMQGLDPEECLRAANARFRTRFIAMEALAAAGGEPLTARSREHLLALWEQVRTT
jgi:ATP diphosphatase